MHTVTILRLLSVAVLGTAGFAVAGCRSTTPPPPINEGRGIVDNRQFVYSHQGDAIAATFTPFIPRDDQAFIASVRAVIQAAYRDDIRGDSARLVGNEVSFKSPRAVYFVMPIKEDTGEIHSLRIRVASK